MKLLTNAAALGHLLKHGDMQGRAVALTRPLWVKMFGVTRADRLDVAVARGVGVIPPYPLEGMRKFGSLWKAYYEAIHDYSSAKEREELLCGVQIIANLYSESAVYDVFKGKYSIFKNGDQKKFVGLEFGYLKVLEVTKDFTSDLTTLQCRCGNTITLRAEQCHGRISCGSCGVPEYFDLEASRQRLTESVRSRLQSCLQEARREAELAVVNPPKVKGMDFAHDERGRVLAHATRKTKLANYFAARRWGFGVDAEQVIQRFCGLPLTPDMELHRMGHEVPGRFVPYAPLTVMWLAPEINRGLHHTNTAIRLPDGRTAPSFAEACRAMGFNEKEQANLRQRITRAKKRSPDAGSVAVAQEVFDRFCREKGLMG